MNPEKLREIINSGEGLTVEFKQSRTKLKRDVFETVGAFLNRNDGHLFLGVDEQGGIVGIEPDSIEKDRVVTENSNKPHGNGIIDPENFSPFPKNPTIARFFKEIGLVDELGSGIRNTYKYSKIYSGDEPIFTEGDVF